jgi:hypothetical protein
MKARTAILKKRSFFDPPHQKATAVEAKKFPCIPDGP